MPSGDELPSASQNRIDAPPFLKTWPRVYGMVLTFLALLLALLYSLTKAFQY